MLAGVVVALLAVGAAHTRTGDTGGTGTSQIPSSTLTPGTPAAVASPPSKSSTATSPPATSPPATASASPTEDFATIYARQRSGVVRIEVVGCSDSGVGTGFLLSPTLIATVDHVVAGSVVVGLIDQGQRTTGEVIGSDPVHDVALVRAARPLTGYHSHIASISPRVGDLVATIGFPIGEPITLTQGGVSGLHRNISVDGQRRTGMVETDAAVNPGNSGGPLLDNTGTVIGLVAALNTEANGIAYAVPATQAISDVRTWEQNQQPCPGQMTEEIPAHVGGPRAYLL